MVRLRHEHEVGRECPNCGGWLESHVSMRAAQHPEATQVNTSGPRKGHKFHVVAVCNGCDDIIEVVQN